MNFDLTEDQLRLQELVADFAKSEVAPVAEEMDRKAEFPTELFRKVGKLGITAIPFDQKYGGMGLGTMDMALAIEQLAKADQTLAVTTMVSVAAGLILQRFGSEEQKLRYLPGIIKGESLGALAGSSEVNFAGICRCFGGFCRPKGRSNDTGAVRRGASACRRGAT